MRVLFDAHWWVSGPPSGRGILKALVQTWLREYPTDELVLRAPAFDRAIIVGELAAAGATAEVVPVGGWAFLPAITAMTSSPRRHRALGVVTQNFTSLRARNAVAVTMIYDAIFVDHPEWFTLKERAYFSLIPSTSRRANLVIANTAAERRRMELAWPWLRDKIAVARLGVPLGLAGAVPVRPASVPEAPGPFMLSVGRLNARKNLARLVDGFLASRRSSHSVLYLVGSADGVTSDFLAGRDHGGRIVPLGGLTDGELRWMYENADLFVFPSLAEGFGMPLIEAQAFGVPSIASDIPPFREIGVSSAYFDPESVSAIAEAIDAAPARQRPETTADDTPWVDLVNQIRERMGRGAGTHG